MIVETARDVTDPASGTSLLTAWGASIAGGGDHVIGGGASRTVTTQQAIDYPGNALGSGSDYTVFLNFLGIPIVEMSFAGPYGVYHSMYDDYYWMTHFGDPGFRYMTTMSDVWGRMALRLANSDVYPFDFVLYASRLGGFISALTRQPDVAAYVDLGPVRAARRAWLTASARLEAAWRPALNGHAGSLAAMNDAMRAVEQQLLFADGIPGRPWFRHALYAPRPSYAAMTLPEIQEAVDAKDWALARTQAAALAMRIDAAAKMVERAASLAPR